MHLVLVLRYLGPSGQVWVLSCSVICRIRVVFGQYRAARTPYVRPQGKYSEAIPLLERALSIRKAKLGDDHHDTVESQDSLDDARRQVHLQAIRYYRSTIFW